MAVSDPLGAAVAVFGASAGAGDVVVRSLDGRWRRLSLISKLVHSCFMTLGYLSSRSLRYMISAAAVCVLALMWWGCDASTDSGSRISDECRRERRRVREVNERQAHEARDGAVEFTFEALSCH